MFALTIIKYLNVFKDGIPRFSSSFKVVSFDALLFERPKERFHERVIIAITFSTHTDEYSILVQQLLVALARLLASLIAMRDQTSCGSEPRKCHHCRIWYQLLVSLFSHGPSHHKTGVDIDSSCKIEPSFSRFNACNIGHPLGSGGISAKITFQEIGSDWIRMLAIRGFYFSAPGFRADPTFAHASGHPFSPTMHSLLL
jgi:hypothetical protein